jgi:hypothetical protein
VQLRTAIILAAGMLTGVIAATEDGTALAVAHSDDGCFSRSEVMLRPIDKERFKTLDQYLAHRKTKGALDYPFYEEVAPGLFRCVVYPRPTTGMPTQVFTREELARKYGFLE